MIYSTWWKQYEKWASGTPTVWRGFFHDGKFKSVIACAHMTYGARMAQKLLRLNSRSTAQ